MSVKKYKTFEEAEKDLIEIKIDEKYYKNALNFIEEALSFAKLRKIPKGIFKYKTFEEAEKDSIKWIINIKE